MANGGFGSGVRGFGRIWVLAGAAAWLVACGSEESPAPAEPPPGAVAETRSAYAVPSAMKIDAGSLPAVTNAWTTVTLPRSYASMVVLATPAYGASSVPLVSRIRNAAGSSFDVRVDRFDKGTAAVTAVPVQYLVLEEGVYTAAVHGIKMEAVRYSSTVTDRSASWRGEIRSYRQGYTSPVVLGQVMTYADARPSVFWSGGSSVTNPPSATALRVGKHVGEDPATTRANETVGYVVVEAGAGTIGGVAWEARLGPDGVRDVTTPPAHYGLGTPGPTTTAVLSQSAMDGSDGSWAVLAGPGAANGADLAVSVDEDNAKDTERSHSGEQVAFFAVNQCPTAASAGQHCGVLGACAADRTCCSDADADGVCDAVDACAGFDDRVDGDQDGRADGCDGCPADPVKIVGGACGCGVADTDSDGDTTPDCNDGCPADPAKNGAGVCGCGVPDTDSDGDGVANCNDACPDDAGKNASGVCGCGIPDTDSDGDGAANCVDACAGDPTKTAPGVCGCGTADTDSDADGLANCVDACPADNPNDSDGDGVCNSADRCPGFDDSVDTDHNGTIDGCQQCFTVADCDDGNECTTSVCSAAGQCSYPPVPAPVPTTWSNGNFENGGFGGFSTFMTANGKAAFLVEQFETTLGVSTFAARMEVGKTSSSVPTTEGGGIRQRVDVKAGSLTITANVAALSPSSTNSDGGTMLLYVDNTLLQTKSFGSVNAGVTYRATLNVTVPSITAGSHLITIEARRQFAFVFNGVRNYVDDIVLSGTSVPPVTPCSTALGGTCDGNGTCVPCADGDSDGVCDANDICPGFDDHVDPDGDGKPTGCDACPNDNPNDSDADTVCNSVDRCPGFDDRVDTDHNGIPDGCQECVTAASCNDSNTCTADACVATHCTHTINAGATCGAGGTCDATGACTNETCRFIPLGDLPGGGVNSSAYAISDDGQTVAGRSLTGTTTYAAFRWKESTGMVKVGSGTTSSGRALSADGSILAGIGGSEVNYPSMWGFRERPGFIETTSTSTEVLAMSADGSIVVGDQNSRAFRWGPTGSITDMTIISNVVLSSPSSAMGISADGSVIVGRAVFSGRPSVGEAFVWTSGSVIPLGDFAQGTSSGLNSEARGVSPDGTRVVGVAAGVSQRQGFTWTAATGMVSLGNNIAPFAVSNENTIVGGEGSAWVSSPRLGTGDARFLLQSCGVTNIAGWNLSELRDVTPDGRAMVGTGFNPSGNYEAVLIRLR